MTLSKATRSSPAAVRAWGGAPGERGQAARAYEIGELNISAICSSFPCALGAGSVSSSRSHSVNDQDSRSVVNNRPPCLGTDRSQVCVTLCPKQFSSLYKMQPELGHKEFKPHGLTASVCVHVCMCMYGHMWTPKDNSGGPSLGTVCLSYFVL